MDRAAYQMLECFLHLSAAEVKLVEELPQESVSLKRSDYILRVTDTAGMTRLVIWEFLS